MKALFRAGTLALALLLCGCGDGGGAAGAPIAAPSPAIPAPNGGEWTKMVVETPEGGFRMGNPDAPVKLVEYASVTCPHCALFSRQATAPLTQLVKSGHLSWEFRHYLLFPTDPAMSLLARCQGASGFFPVTEQLYASQSEWSEKVQDLSSADLQRIRALPPEQQVSAMVKSAGLDRLMQRAEIERCLADDRQLKKLVALTSLGDREGVPGTPAFFINGKIVADVGDWGALRPALESALRR